MIFKDTRHTKKSYFKGIRKERKRDSTASPGSLASESLWMAMKVSYSLSQLCFHQKQMWSGPTLPAEGLGRHPCKIWTKSLCKGGLNTHLPRLISQWFTRPDPTGKVLSQIKTTDCLTFITCKTFRGGTKTMRRWDSIQKFNHTKQPNIPRG